ncbi:MAG: hypothetical protein KBF80_10005, partial [Flavobacteriales bacterium]|nr:hypothetical protein [Flavobacteriales bacterium]
MSKVALCIPELGVTKVRFPKERKSELYVMAFTCDGRSPGTDSTGKPAPKGNNSIAAANETLPNLEPEVMNLSALRYTYVAVSNLFPRVKAEQSVPLMGSGILLYPNMDPKGMVHTYIAVIDSDKGTRDVGKTLNGLFTDKEVKGVVDQLAKGGTGNLLYAQLLNAIVTKLPSFLSKDRDDLLLASQFSGFDYDNYGCDAGTTRKDFQRGNDRAWMKLRVMVN